MRKENDTTEAVKVHANTGRSRVKTRDRHLDEDRHRQRNVGRIHGNVPRGSEGNKMNATKRKLNLKTLKLLKGGHSPYGGMCVMEAVAYVSGEPWTDSPACVSPVIATFCRKWNDDLNDDDRQKLKPYIKRMIGTNTGKEDDERRAWMLADWMVRTYLQAWLRLAKLDAQADTVATLAEMDSAGVMKVIKPTIAM